jgi:energy-coupling factor transporter ATP-binding protein EcfA2
MLELRDITFRYTDTPILQSVNLEISEGELVVVAGRTGVGKSTLLGIFNGLVPSFTGGRLSGDVLWEGRSIIRTPPRERVDLIGYVGQDPSASFVTDTVEEELAYGMEQLGLDPQTMRRRVEETLDLLGIAELRNRDMRTLSGGQQQRVAIGSVLTMHPRLLVLDEPTSALDPTAAEEVMATLTRLVHDLDISVVIAEHRLERVIPFADRIIEVVGDGSILVGDPREVLENLPVVPPIIELAKLAGWKPLPLTVREARRLAAPLSIGAPPTYVEVAPIATEPLLRATDVSVAYGRKVAVREVDFTLNAGEISILMGRNGSGKSTLLWALQGSRKRSGGRIQVVGEDPERLGAEERRKLVGLVPQTAADLLYLETVSAELAQADTESDATPGTAAGLLAKLVPGIDHQAHPRDLSEGQRLALVLAIVLTARPKVIALDEPTRGLDYPGKAALATILRQLADQGRGVLVATHDVEFAALVADRISVMAEGEIVSTGPAPDVISESPAFAPQVTKIFGPGWLRVDQVAERLEAS